MSEPIIEKRCYRCGTPCMPCTCAPCPRCDRLACVTCDLPPERISSTWCPDAPGIGSYTLRRDTPIPPHGGPTRSVSDKPPEAMHIQAEEFVRTYNSNELLPYPAPEIARAIERVFWFLGAGISAAVCSMIFLGCVAIGRLER